MVTIKFLPLMAAIMGFLAVGIGAFGSHALRHVLSAEGMRIFQSAWQYHMVHVFAVFASAWAFAQFSSDYIAWAGWLFVLGTAIFSGSLYLLALTEIAFLGIVTPIGGVLLLIGWFFLAWGIWGSV